MREEHRLRVFENRVLRKIMGQRGNRKQLHKREFYLFNSFIICIKTGPGGKEEGSFGQGCCLSPILLNAYSDYFTKEPLEVLETSK